MSDKKTSNRSGATLLVVVAAAFVVLAFILAAAFLLQRGAESEDITALMTPIIGGTTVPTATPVAVMPDPPNDGRQVSAEAAVGASVMAASADGGGVRVYSDARDDGLIMDLYPDGAEFVVLEPSGEYDTYPVQQNGAQWVRVRTADGLVGWAALAELAPVE